MLNAKLVIGAVFALTLSSGVVAGMLVSRIPGGPSHPGEVSSSAHVTMLEQVLQLKPDQQQKMQKIWEGVRDKADSCYAQAQDLQRRQWAEMAAMLTPEQKVKFNSIQTEFQSRFDELKRQRENEFTKAVRDTDAILSEDQRKQFHELIEKRLGETPPWLTLPKMPTESATTPGA
jgi:hypothetical protein